MKNISVYVKWTSPKLEWTTSSNKQLPQNMSPIEYLNLTVPSFIRHDLVIKICVTFSLSMCAARSMWACLSFRELMLCWSPCSCTISSWCSPSSKALSISSCGKQNHRGRERLTSSASSYLEKKIHFFQRTSSSIFRTLNWLAHQLGLVSGSEVEPMLLYC